MSGETKTRRVAIEMSRGSLLLSSVGLESVLVAIAVLVMWWTGLRPLISLDAVGLGKGALTGLIMAGAAIALLHSSAAAFARIREDFDLFIRLFRKSTVPDLAVIALLAGVCEEMLFRGLLQTWLTEVTHSQIGMAFAAVVFGISHAISLPYMVFVSLLGLCLGYVYHHTESLGAAITAHSLYDFLALYYGTRIYRAPEPE